MSTTADQQTEATAEQSTFIVEDGYLMFKGVIPPPVKKPSIWDELVTEDEIFGDHYHLDGSIQNMFDYLKSVLPDIRFLNSHNPCVDELTIYTNYNFKLTTYAKYEGHDCLVPLMDPNLSHSILGVPIFKLTRFDVDKNITYSIYTAAKGVAMYYGQNEQVNFLDDFNVKKGTWPCVYLRYLYGDKERNEYFAKLDKKIQDLIEQNAVLTRLKARDEHRMKPINDNLNPYLDDDKFDEPSSCRRHE